MPPSVLVVGVVCYSGLFVLWEYIAPILYVFYNTGIDIVYKCRLYSYTLIIYSVSEYFHKEEL